MEIGIVGVGRMGFGMAKRLIKAGHKCFVFDPNQTAVAAICKEGAVGVENLEEFVKVLSTPRIIWIMAPLQFVEGIVTSLRNLLSPGDIVIDGGNCYYKDDIRRSIALNEKGIKFLDVGTSGGVWGEERGYCLMVGGEKSAYQTIIPILTSLAPGVSNVPRSPERSGALSTSEQGFLYCGPSGSGHFAKMVHNGIEYGMMQAYAEGFDLLQSADRLVLENGEKFEFNVGELSETWRRGSVISSWLLDLTSQVLHEDPNLAAYSGKVDDTGEGRWTINAAIEAAVPVPVLAASLFSRFRSRVGNLFGEKLISAMRNKFGGHVERK